MANNNNEQLKPTSNKNNMSNLIETNTTTLQKQRETSKKQILTQHNIFMIKNKLVSDITHAIQLVQKNFLEKNDYNKQMTNSDFQVHELCQHLDFLFLFGLKKPDEAYWKLVLELTHKDFVQDLNKLLNVTTCFGKSRAWLYHALNDNLMESYLRCLSDDKKITSKYYLKESSIIADDQVVSVLITLVSGLENVEFKLFNDVPYLDQSCWPTHFNVKRIFVDTILNSNASVSSLDTSSTISHIVDLNNLNINQPDNIAKKQIVNKTTLIRRRRRNSRRANTVTLDDTPINTFSDINKRIYEIKSSKDVGNSTADEEEQDQENYEESESIKDEESDVESDEPTLNLSKREQDKKIENEIEQLRKENDLIISNKKLKKKFTKPLVIGNNQSSSCSSFLSNNNGINNQDLVASSLKASDHFDKKIEDLENYSHIIEDATRKMDACFKDMNNVYTDLGDNYTGSNNDDEIMPVVKEIKKVEDKQPDQFNKSNNLVDETTKTDFVEEESNSDSDMYSSNQNEDVNTTTSENLTNESNLSQIESENNYLTNFKHEMRQEIKVDTNLKLMLMINIFQNGENEQLFKFFKTTRGHSQGEIEKINLLVTSHGLYVLIKNDSSEIDDLKMTKKKLNPESTYRKEFYLSHTQFDYIEVGLEAQAIHIVCMNKRQSFWITTACRILTDSFIEAIQSARQSNATRLLPLSVFHEATQQRLALTKFIANEEKLTIQDIKLNKYQLVYYEDQNSSTNQLIHRDGFLFYFNKSASASNLEWKSGYFVLKNDVLAQYRNENDKRPNQIIKLNGEDFLNCRKNNNTSKANTIELIFSNGNVLYLSSKTEADAIDWLQIFCRVISLGNIDTDVPAYSCVPCGTVITTNKIYFCHEDLSTGFYRLLEGIKLQEINRISFDNEESFFCILHDDIDSKKGKFWFVYFLDENERNLFITGFKEAWELLFQVSFTIERCKSSELRKRCIRSVRLIHNEFES